MVSYRNTCQPGDICRFAGSTNVGFVCRTCRLPICHRDNTVQHDYAAQIFSLDELLFVGVLVRPGVISLYAIAPPHARAIYFIRDLISFVHMP